MTRTASIIFLNLFLTTSFLFAQQKITDTLYFNHNKYDLSDVAKNNLNSLFENLKGRKILNIDLSGYTDIDGSDKYNLILSQKRTKVVLDYFVSKGINIDIIKTKFYGKRKEIALNEKKKNRRVEIVIETKEITDSIKQKVVEKKEIVISDIFEKLKKKPQKFKCSANKNIIIKGKEGTVIIIPANSLVNKNGDVVIGEVNISLEEFYKKSDMISANLNTISNTKILETAGMINISAFYSSEQLTLRNGQEIIIQMSAKDTLKGMQTFVAENNGNEMNWNLAKSYQIDSSVANTNQQQKRIIRHGFLFHHLRGLFMRKSSVRNGSDYTEYQGVNDTAVQNQLGKVDNIIIRSNKLGWINCDRFPDIKNKTNVTITVDTTYWPVVRLIFKNINSIMPGRYTSNKEVEFINIPVGYRVTLIAFSLVNNEPYYTSKEIVISKDLKLNLDLIKTTLPKLEEDLKKLD